MNTNVNSYRISITPAEEIMIIISGEETESTKILLDYFYLLPIFELLDDKNEFLFLRFVVQKKMRDLILFCSVFLDSSPQSVND